MRILIFLILIKPNNISRLINDDTIEIEPKLLYARDSWLVSGDKYEKYVITSTWIMVKNKNIIRVMVAVRPTLQYLVLSNDFIVWNKNTYFWNMDNYDIENKN